MKRTKKTEAAPDNKGAVALVALREQHHAFGPSKWPPLLECPCWESKTPTADTQRGTELHSVFEAVMLGKYEGEPDDMLERHVVNAARNILRTAKPAWGRFFVEEEVYLPDLDGSDSGIHGRMDLGWVDEETRKVHVVDLKLSEHPDRDHRAQLLAYAMGFVNRLAFVPELIVLRVVYADSGNESREELYFTDAFGEYAANFRRIAKIGRDEGCTSPRQCGWCDLCARFADCAAMQAVVKQASPRLAEAAKPAVWGDYTPERKAQACALAETLAKWCSAVKENAAADAKNGERIEDSANGIFYGLQERRGAWHGEALSVWDAVKPHLSAEEFRACLEVRLAPLKSALKGKGVKSDEADALLEGCGQRNPSTKVFVRKGVPA